MRRGMCLASQTVFALRSMMIQHLFRRYHTMGGARAAGVKPPKSERSIIPNISSVILFSWSTKYQGVKPLLSVKVLIEYLNKTIFYALFPSGVQGKGRSNVFPCFMAILAIARS